MAIDQAKLVEKVVSWIVPEDALIKFEGAEDANKIADYIVNNLAKYPVAQGDKVKIGFDDKTSTVTFIQKVKGTSTNQNTTQSSNQGNEVVKTLTVNGVSIKTNSLIFKEEENVWYTMSDAVSKIVKAGGFEKGTNVEIKVQPKEKGNDVIVFISKKGSSPVQTKQEISNQYKPKSNATQLSIEAQASVNSANRVVASLVSLGNLKSEEAKGVINELAHYNFDLIQELKSK